MEEKLEEMKKSQLAHGGTTDGPNEIPQAASEYYASVRRC